MRKNSGTLHSWARIFAEPEFLFAQVPGAYAVKSGGVVIELNFDLQLDPSRRKDFFTALGDDGKVECFLPPTSDNAALLRLFPHEVSSFDAMYGERPMVRDLGTGDFHHIHHIYFPVTDKF